MIGSDEKKTVKKIDIHAHTVRVLGITSPYGLNFAYPDELFKMYETLGVERGVLLPLISPDRAWTTISNEDVFEITEKYPDRFDCFCNIDPRMGENSEKTDFGFIIRYYQSKGAKGLGEITANLFFDDPRCMALFRACEEAGMSLTFHVGTADGDYGVIDDFGLPRLEKVLKTFPNLKLLGHSTRFWTHISGDVTPETMATYPTGKVVEGGRLVELMRRYPNLCGDLSAHSGFNAVSRDPEFGCAFMEEFQDRLFFGLDICSTENMTRNFRVGLPSYLDEMMLSGKLSYEAYWKISRGNALKLLGR